MRSPLVTVSSGFFQETTRRAMSPAICLNSIFPCAVARVKMFCSFWLEALGSQAAINFPAFRFGGELSLSLEPLLRL